jgi:TolB protein
MTQPFPHPTLSGPVPRPQGSPRLLPLLGLALLGFAPLALAQEEVFLKVTNAGLQRVVIAIPAFAVRPGADIQAASVFINTLKQDLDQTSVIGVLPDENARLVEPAPNNPDLTRKRWRAVGAQLLLDGSYAGAGSQLVVEVRLWDLTSGETAYSRRYQSSATLATTMAHTLANELVRLFTGKPGPFLSRIAFISDRSGSKELWLMRWDGSDEQQLTNHKSIALAPAWSPDGQLLAFTSFLHGSAELMLLKPTQGVLKTLSNLPGVNSSACFSPDGSKIVFATGDGGTTNIFVVPAEGGTPEQLTSIRGIATQPAWSPSGRQIVFTSNSGGSPQLYAMDAEGTNVRRLTIEDKFADEAAWAPDGVRLAYTTKVDERFQIAVLDLRTNTRTLVSGPGSNESPCWSPDGTMLAFVSNRTGAKQIYITDPAGRPRQITSSGNNLQPAWVSQVQ